MKKVFLLTAFFAFCYAVSFAQETKFGVRAGVNLPSLSYSGDAEQLIPEGAESKSTLNFSFTGYADIPVSENFSIQPGIGVNGKGGRIVSTENNDNRIDLNLLYIDIPVNAVGKLPVSFGKLFLGAGPYFGYAVSGKSKTTIDGESETEKLDLGNSEDDNLNPIDFGVNFLGGVELQSGVTIHAGYGLGLSNLIPKDSRGESDAKTSTRTLTFGLGFLF